MLIDYKGRLLGYLDQLKETGRIDYYICVYQDMSNVFVTTHYEVPMPSPSVVFSLPPGANIYRTLLEFVYFIEGRGWKVQEIDHKPSTDDLRKRYQLRADACEQDIVRAVLTMWYEGRPATWDDMSVFRVVPKYGDTYRVGTAKNGLKFMLIVKDHVMRTVLEPYTGSKLHENNKRRRRHE